MSTLANHAFAKMNGIGNEIVVVDLRDSKATVTPEDARAVGSPAGVPYDQLMVLQPPRLSGPLNQRFSMNPSLGLGGDQPQPLPQIQLRPQLIHRPLPAANFLRCRRRQKPRRQHRPPALRLRRIDQFKKRPRTKQIQVRRIRMLRIEKFRPSRPLKSTGRTSLSDPRSIQPA